MTCLFVFSAALMICILCGIRKATTDESKDLLCITCVWAVLVLVLLAHHIGETRVKDFQYVPAEYIAENSTSTYFGTEDGNIFWVQNEFHYPEYVPYLLGMDTKGTSDVTDDEILTVWRLCE